MGEVFLKDCLLNVPKAIYVGDSQMVWSFRIRDNPVGKNKVILILTIFNSEENLILINHLNLILSMFSIRVIRMLNTHWVMQCGSQAVVKLGLLSTSLSLMWISSSTVSAYILRSCFIVSTKYVFVAEWAINRHIVIKMFLPPMQSHLEVTIKSFM